MTATHSLLQTAGGGFAVPLIRPRDQPCNCVAHQQDPSLFALWRCERSRVCLRLKQTHVLGNALFGYYVLPQGD